MKPGLIIFKLLSEDLAMQTALGPSRVNASMWPIFRLHAPQDETAPFITYQQSNENIDHVAQGMKVRTPFMQVNVWATTPDQADTIAELAIGILDGQFGSVRDGDSFQEFDNILYTNNIETFEPNLEPPLYGRQLEFQIRIA